MGLEVFLKRTKSVPVQAKSGPLRTVRWLVCHSSIAEERQRRETKYAANLTYPECINNLEFLPDFLKRSDLSKCMKLT